MTAVLTPKQQEANRLLAGPARNIMLRGGSRSGKTFLLVRALVQRAINAPNSRHAIFRFRFNHAKTSVWADTLPKVMKLCFPTLRPRFDKTDFYVELPNGSQIWIGGLDDKERVEKILGAEYATLYFNESSQIPWGSIETAMSRLAQKVELAPEIAKATGRTHLALKAYFDCNPPSKLHWSYQLFRAKLKPGTREAVANPDDYVEMQINPDDNRENLPAEYFDVLAGMSAVKRLRFEDGEWASEVNGALWSLEDRKVEGGRDIPGIDRFRVSADQLPELVRIVVSVDPSGTKGDGSGDDIGIVAVGLGVDGRGYVLEDGTCQLSPEGWGRRAVDLYHRHEADSIIGERNFGGDMVRFTIQTADATVPFKEVVASRGKVVRAEPVSALYEQGKVSHVGVLADLEDQMCNFTASGYVGDGSPDRADALVWALTELMLGARPVFSITPSDLSCAPFPIPTSWPRGFAMKVEPDRTCALWAAYDRDGDILYVTTEHSRRYADARANAQAIVARGDWIPGLATVDASNQMDAQQLLAIYHSLKLKVMLDDASGESGIATMTDRISTGRLKVFETCTEFFKEYRGYRRDEDDKIIGGGLMHCAQSLARPNAIKRMVAKAPEKILAQRVTHVGDPVAGY